MSEITTKRLNPDGSITVTDYADIISTIGSKVIRPNGGNALTSYGTLWQDFQDISASAWQVESGFGQVFTDTNYVKNGSIGLRHTNLKTDQTLASVGVIKKTVNKDLSAMTSITLLVYIPDPTKVLTISFYLANDTNNTNKFLAQKSFNNNQLKYGWNAIALAKADFTNSGSPSWSVNIAMIRIAITANTGMQYDIHFDSIILNTAAKPMCILTFDGGWLGQYSTALPILQAAGMVGSSFLTSSVTANPTALLMNVAQAKTLEAAGWYIGNHSTQHLNPSNLTEAEFKAEVSGCIQWLTANNFKPESILHYVYPYGEGSMLNTNHEKWLKELGILTARSTVGDKQSLVCLDGEIFALKAFGVANASALATVTTFIDKCIAANATCILFLHNVLPDAQATLENDVKQTVFQGIVDYLKDKMNVVTSHEWYQIVTGQRDLISRI